MLLKSLFIRGLHGALTLNVNFNEEITLLVGINGSGKTSVLNVIDWLLKPNLQQLVAATYDSLELSFIEEGKSYSLTAVKTESLVILTLTGTDTPFEPITINLDMHMDSEDARVMEKYAGLTPEKHERPMWELLKSFAKPTAISLDRSISAESDEVEYIETPKGMMTRRARAKSPLGYVQEITSEKYAEFRSKAIVNDSELKADIVISALQQSDIRAEDAFGKPMSDKEIKTLEEKVISYLTGTVKSKDIASQIHGFFTSSRMLVAAQKHFGRERNLLLNFATLRYRQIERLAKAFNDFENKNAAAFKQLSDYLSAVNRFFADSNKELYFDESTGKLVFSFVEAGSRIGVKRAISHLSSGERQILILFTFLAFASCSQSVFIVDEPELSLHPKWQHEFMETFLSLRPQGTQLILATHSPDIVGRFKNACVTLRGIRV